MPQIKERKFGFFMFKTFISEYV